MYVFVCLELGVSNIDLEFNELLRTTNLPFTATLERENSYTYVYKRKYYEPSVENEAVKRRADIFTITYHFMMVYGGLSIWWLFNWLRLVYCKLLQVQHAYLLIIFVLFLESDYHFKVNILWIEFFESCLLLRTTDIVNSWKFRLIEMDLSQCVKRME